MSWTSAMIFQYTCIELKCHRVKGNVHACMLAYQSCFLQEVAVIFNGKYKATTIWVSNNQK